MSGAALTDAPSAPPDNVICLGLPRPPRERWNSLSGGLLRNDDMPSNTVRISDERLMRACRVRGVPKPALTSGEQVEQVKAVLSPEMEVIFALIQALDERTATGKPKTGSIHNRVLGRMQMVNAKGDRPMADKALERLVTMKWWGRS